MINLNSNSIAGIAGNPLPDSGSDSIQLVFLIYRLDLKRSPRSPRAGSSGGGLQVLTLKAGNQSGVNSGCSVRGNLTLENLIRTVSRNFREHPRSRQPSGGKGERLPVNCVNPPPSNLRVKFPMRRRVSTRPCLEGNKTATNQTASVFPLFFAGFCSPSSPVVDTIFIPGINPASPPRNLVFAACSAHFTLVPTSAPSGQLRHLFRAAKGSEHQPSMKITKAINHGQTRYRVNEPQGPDGKRQRKFFDTRGSLGRCKAT